MAWVKSKKGLCKGSEALVVGRALCLRISLTTVVSASAFDNHSDVNKQTTKHSTCTHTQ